MSVTSVRPVSISFNIDGDGYKIYSCRWEVTVTDPYELPLTISTAEGITQYGHTLNFGTISDSEVFCDGKNVDPILVGDTNLQRSVVATFSNKPSKKGKSGNGSIVTNPLYEPWKKGGSFAVGTRVTGIDKDGVPIMTTAKERKYFDVPDGYDTLSLEGPSVSMSLPQRAQAVVHCNSTEIWGLSARRVFLAQWQWQELFAGVNSYFYHRMEFWIKYDGWNEVWVNEGTQTYDFDAAGQRQINPIIPVNDHGGKLISYLDINGQLIPSEALLTPSVPPIVINTSQVILEFDFTSLSGSIGLPNPLPGNFV